MSTAPPSARSDVDSAYDECAAITKAASTNFYYAFLTLPPEKRRAIYATYAFCRLCDDIVDEPDRRATAAVELKNVRAKLAATYRGETDGPIWTALDDARRRFGVRHEHFSAVIDGCEMDLAGARYETFEDLVEYCKRVASAVGLVCIEVCGYDDKAAVEYAVDLGIAMQLTNIIRDVAEDAAEGRIYLPQEDLRRFDYSEADLMTGVVNGNLRKLIEFEVQRAHKYFDSGYRLFPLLDRKARACPETMASVYKSLLDRIESADYDVLSNRVSLGTTRKLALALRLWLLSRAPWPWR